MNMSYKYDKADKKIIVASEKGELTEREYFDNIDELLVEENIIEELEKELKELEIKKYSYEGIIQDLQKQMKELEKRKKVINRNKIIIFAIVMLGLTLETYFLAPIETLEDFLYLEITGLGFSTSITMLYARLVKDDVSPTLTELSEKLESVAVSLTEIEINNLNKILEKEKQRYEELQELQSREKEVQMQNNNQ